MFRVLLLGLLAIVASVAAWRRDPDVVMCGENRWGRGCVYYLYDLLLSLHYQRRLQDYRQLQAM